MDQLRIKEILSNYDEISKLAEVWLKKPNVSKAQLERGYEVSRVAAQHSKYVPMTPYFKNMLKAFGDIDEGGRLETGAPITKAEKWLDEFVRAILLQQSGKFSDKYDWNLPLTDVQHYWTQCWVNWDLSKFRDLQPGQVEEVNKVLDEYAYPTDRDNIRSMLENDVLFQKAIEVVLERVPSVSATKEIIEVDLPFMTKHTNVGFVPPYLGFGNDRSIVSGTNKTYAQLTMDIAEGIKNRPDKLNDYNVSEEFTRYQKGKGRLIIAPSRIIALVLNQLEHIEIENYKLRSSLFAGYNDSIKLKQVMVDMYQQADKRGLKMANFDYHRFDKNIVIGLIKLIGAMSVSKCADKRSKDLAKYRAALMCKTWIIAGTKDKAALLEIFGRMFSGNIDTNRGGGLINATSMTYLLMLQDDKFVREVASVLGTYMLVMGDDNLACFNPNKFSLTRLQEDGKTKLHHEIDDPSKIAYGPIFLQYRLFDYNGLLMFLYAWTRVLKSVLTKERAGHLGPCGWTLSIYQQCAKCVDIDHPEVTEFVAPLVNLLAYFDDEKLMLDRSIADITKGAALEDAEAAKVGKRFASTAEQLYDGDPSKSYQYKKQGSKIEFDDSFLAKVQQILKDAYDPQYFSKHGIGLPKIK